MRDLPSLARELGTTGLQVTVDIGGDVAGVPRGVGLAVYRIVQEALSNALRHGQARHAVVTVFAGTHSVDVDVADDGTGSGPQHNTGQGHGLIGMRERVAVYGGTMSVGCSATGGYRVAARLPFEREVDG